MSNFFSQRSMLIGVMAYIIFDIVALGAFLFPAINIILLPIIVIAALFLFLTKPQWLLFLPLAELAWGSFGSALAWDINEVRVPLRMVIFAMAIGSWGLLAVQKRVSIPRLQSAGMMTFMMLLAISIWGIANGLANGNGLGVVYDDSNAYFFLLYLPVWLSVVRAEDAKHIVSIIFASGAALAAKTLLLFHVFANQYEWANIPLLYIWIRDMRIGEITPAGGSIWRIFIQSQLYLSIAFVINTVRMYTSQKNISARSLLFPALLMVGIAISLSRSFWLGIAFVAGVLAVIFLPWIIRNIKKVLLRSMILAGALVLALSVVFIASISASGDQSLSQALLRRISDSSTEAAGASRIQLLGPLTEAAQEHAFVGSGFGKLVTYFSVDPRYKNAINPTGELTTYAFELGYIDQWLKIGAVALGIFVLLLLYQLYRGWMITFRHPEYARWTIAFAAGLLFIMIVHGLSPYLNHPLGLGYFFIVVVLFDAFSREHDVKANS